MARVVLWLALVCSLVKAYHKLLPNEELTLLENIESGDYNVYVVQFYDGDDEDKKKL